jgi:uncharacterized protein YabN with tetrapyrrole methylase and pyrophosphatase domain
MTRTGLAAPSPSCRRAAIEVPWELEVPRADVHLVGYGNRLPNDLTLEALAVLKRCRRLFGAPPIHAPSLGLAPMESLMGHYRAGRRRAEIHAAMAEEVLAAGTREAPVGFATYGSAMVGMPVCHQVLAQAAARGLSVHVSGAPSALDGIWAQLGVDPLAGAVVWDATAFIQAGAEPSTGASLMLAAVGLMELSVANPIMALRERLLRFYAADREILFVTAPAATQYAPRAELERLRLSDLVRAGAHALSTLVVPAQAADAGSPPRISRRIHHSTIGGHDHAPTSTQAPRAQGG